MGSSPIIQIPFLKRGVMNINWILEKNIFDTEKEMIKIIESNGFSAHVFKYIPILCNIKTIPVSNKEIVIFYGSLNAASVINKKFNFWPGVIGNFDLYDCCNYYPYFHKNLLNSNCAMLTFSDLIKKKKNLFSKFGVNNRIFIRPNSGMKSFTGNLVTWDEYEKMIDCGFQCYNEIPADSIVLVSKPKTIKKEWRFVVSGTEVIGGSQYRINGRFKESSEVDLEAIEFVKNILLNTTYSPDIVWVMDICKLDNEKLYVLEVGAFSCSGLYKINLEKLIYRVSNIIHLKKGIL